MLSPELLHDKLVLQVGVGSGGAPVNDHLTMNGVRRWVLYDPDAYDEVNLVKHPRQRQGVGRPKVEIQREWILDRNPGAEVTIHERDVLALPEFSAAVREADLVLCCADRQEVRLYVNAIALEARRACVTASVFRQGFGGEVYGYIPGVWGCFDCMLRVATEQEWNIQEESTELLPAEREAIYGLNLRDFKACGLSMDIQTIAIIQARMALDILLAGTPRRFDPLPANWVIFYNRPVRNNQLSGFLKSLHLKVKPRQDCQCKDS